MQIYVADRVEINKIILPSNSFIDCSVSQQSEIPSLMKLVSIFSIWQKIIW